ncbi:unnamed protein product [Lactuca saligna]|uniref:Uncharacterized protein n=1 Tax=Lactuca saligna TaxID=75948 RepID=A0AA35UYY8_LACSI|nr:unnamed protein product [Lactuca saligna]
MADPSFDTGHHTHFDIELGRIIDCGLRESRTVDTKSLCIIAGKLVWSIQIDLHIIDNGGYDDEVGIGNNSLCLLYFVRSHPLICKMDPKLAWHFGSLSKVSQDAFTAAIVVSIAFSFIHASLVVAIMKTRLRAMVARDEFIRRRNKAATIVQCRLPFVHEKVTATPYKFAISAHMTNLLMHSPNHSLVLHSKDYVPRLESPDGSSILRGCIKE